MSFRYGTLFGILTLFLTLPGCAVNNKDMLHFLREHEHQVSAIEYRVGIPDSIGIDDTDTVGRRLYFGE